MLEKNLVHGPNESVSKCILAAMVLMFITGLSLCLESIQNSSQESLNAPFLNGLFSSGFSRGKTAH